jgi:hypothetical protein
MTDFELFLVFQTYCRAGRETLRRRHGLELQSMSHMGLLEVEFEDKKHVSQNFYTRINVPFRKLFLNTLQILNRRHRIFITKTIKDLYFQ